MKRYFRTNIIMLIVFCIMPVFSPANAESDIKEGYDENTEIEVRGTVTEVVRAMRGPVILKLKAENKTYNVVTAPMWHLSREGISFHPGSEWEIKGSKYFGKDGNLYIIGRELKSPGDGKTIILRDSSCKPLWMGHRKQERQWP